MWNCLYLFGAIDKTDSTTLPAAAALFTCTVSQAHVPSQLSIAMCLSPDGTFDVNKYWLYAVSLLARAQSLSAAIHSSMVGDGLLDDANLFMARKFRNWFCLPCTSYKDLLTQIKLDDRFERWCVFKTNAKKLPHQAATSWFPALFGARLDFWWYWGTYCYFDKCSSHILPCIHWRWVHLALFYAR